jgi:hypothetical protein
MGGPGPQKFSSILYYYVSSISLSLFVGKHCMMLFNTCWLYIVHVRVLEALVDTHVDGLFLYQFDTGSWSCRVVVQKGG